MKYSIWIVPPADVFSYYENVILQLSRKYKTKSFIPHITVVGDLDLDFEIIKERVYELLRDVKPFTILMEDVSYTEEYFTSLFLNAKSNELMKLGVLARRIFASKKGDYIPHLSLLYGNISKENKINESNIILRKEFICNSVCIVKSSSSIPEDEWEILEEVQLG